MGQADVPTNHAAANLLAASSPAVTAAERDVIDAAEKWRRVHADQATIKLDAAVDRLAAARNDTDRAER